MDRRSWGLLIALAAIWGASYMFIKVGLRDFSPAMVACVRVALAALVIAPFAIARGALGGVRAVLGLLVVTAAVQVAAPFLLIALGEQEISSALAGILIATAPIFTAILAIWVDHEERSQGLRLAGIGVGLAGVVVLLGVDLGGSGAALLGGLAVVLAGLGYAVGGLLAKRRLTALDPIGMTATVMAASAIMLAPAALASPPTETPGLGPVAAVVTLGVVGTGAAFVIFYSLIARVGPARSLLVTYLAPGFAVGYGATLLGERITVATVAGLALILAGAWLASEGRLPLRRRLVGPAPQEGGGEVAVAGELATERFDDR